ncbi:MAG: HAD-IIA family hydrolase [Anaerolineae bacterium]|nr:HAD-IIA family hydrolase [Anaerolineae bacterium]
MNLAAIQAFIFDMDGVLYRGDVAILGARDFLADLMAAYVPFRLLTNNSGATPEQYASRLAVMGISVAPEHIMTSALATADYLAEVSPHGGRVYAIGGEGVRDALRRRGFELVPDAPADYVVVGIDWNVNYDAFRRANAAIRGGARFIGTNGDKTFPHPDGIVPGNGALLAFLETATGVKPTVIGKPEVGIFTQTAHSMGVSADLTAMVGDRLDTDIEGAARAGMRSIFLLSGVHTRDDLVWAPAQPDIVYDDIAALRAAWLGRLSANL